MTELSVLIPTVGDRPKLLAQVLDALHTQVPDAEVLVLEGCSWGEGLNRLAARASGEYLLTCCDDTVPQPGFFAAARLATDRGVMAAQRYFKADGTPQNPDFDLAAAGTPLPWSRGYLLTQELYQRIGPFLDLSWYVDFDYSERLLTAGVPIVATDGYNFTHLDGPREWLTAAENRRQQTVYEDAQRDRQRADVA